MPFLAHEHLQPFPPEVIIPFIRLRRHIAVQIHIPGRNPPFGRMAERDAFGFGHAIDVELAGPPFVQALRAVDGPEDERHRQVVQTDAAFWDLGVDVCLGGGGIAVEEVFVEDVVVPDALELRPGGIHHRLAMEGRVVELVEGSLESCRR